MFVHHVLLAECLVSSLQAICHAVPKSQVQVMDFDIVSTSNYLGATQRGLPMTREELLRRAEAGDDQALDALHEEQENRPVVHIVRHWVLGPCQHRVTCACHHSPGERAYCYVCREFQVVLNEEVEEVRA